MANWNFEDQRDLAVITTKRILNNSGWIGCVTHDAEDGGWQFLERKDKQPKVNEAAVVSLQNVVDLDPTIMDLADLPIGWQAWRATRESQWSRRRKQ